MAHSWVCACAWPSVKDAHHIEDLATSGASFSALLETAAKAGGPCIVSCEAPAFEAAVDVITAGSGTPFATATEGPAEAAEEPAALDVAAAAVVTIAEAPCEKLSAAAADDVAAGTGMRGPTEEGAPDVIADAVNDASEQPQQQAQWGPSIKQQPAMQAEREHLQPDQRERAAPRAASPSSAAEQQLLAATAHPPTGVVGARWRTSEVVHMSPTAVSARKLAPAAPLDTCGGGCGKAAARGLTSVRSFRLTDCAMEDAE